MEFKFEVLKTLQTTSWLLMIIQAPCTELLSFELLCTREKSLDHRLITDKTVHPSATQQVTCTRTHANYQQAMHSNTQVS